jgi:hypothetical protein
MAVLANPNRPALTIISAMHVVSEALLAHNARLIPPPPLTTVDDYCTLTTEGVTNNSDVLEHTNLKVNTSLNTRVHGGARRAD